MKRNASIAAFSLNIIISMALLYFIYVNHSYKVTYVCILNHNVYSLPLSLMAILFVFTGLIMGFLSSKITSYRNQKAVSAYEMRTESLSVKSEEDEAKIKALEAKIETLEAALESALNNNK